MPHTDRVKLLAGPFTAPRLRRGARAFCLYRDAEVVITRWTDARITWPRCMVRRRGGGSGLLVEEELARAIRTESAAAIKYWWGVSDHAVWKWRKALGVNRLSNPGTVRLMVAASMKGADAVRGVSLPPYVVEERRKRAKRLNLGRFLKPGHHGPLWTKEHLAMLGKRPDEELAKLFGRT